MDVKETKEMLEAIAVTGGLVLRELKKGQDVKVAITNVVAAIVGQPGMVDKLKNAIDGASAIPDEMRDLDFLEGVDLAQSALGYLLEAYKSVKE